MPAGSGNHRAQVTVTANTTSANKDVAKLTKRLHQAEMATNRLGKAGKKTGTKLTLMGKAGKAAGAAMSGAGSLAIGVTAAAFAIDRAAQRSTEWSNVNKKLRISVDAASKAVYGQVDSLVLAKNAAKLNSQEIMVSDAAYAKFAGGVANLADAHGVDLEQALNGTTKAILKGNTKGLESLGIHLDMTTEVDKLAKATNRSTIEISLREKQLIVEQHVMAQSALATAAYGDTVNNAAQGWTKMKNAGVDALDVLSDKVFELGNNVEILGTDIKRMLEDRMIFFGQSIEDAEVNTHRLISAFKALALVQGLQFDAAADAAGEALDSKKAIAAVERNRNERAYASALEESAKIARKVNRIVLEGHEAEARRNAKAKAKGGGRGKSKSKADRPTFDAEKLAISQAERRVELIKLLDAGTWKLLNAERARFDLQLDLAKKQGDINKQEQLVQARAIELHKRKLEREAEATAKAEARKMIELDAFQNEREVAAARLENQLQFAETATARHQIVSQISTVEHEANMQELAVRREILEARFPEDEIDRLEIQRELAVVDHEAKMAILDDENQRRIASNKLQEELAAQEAARRKRNLQLFSTTHETMAGITDQSVQIGAIAAEMNTKNEDERARKRMRIMGGLAVAHGIFDTARAVSAFASYNIPQGVLYLGSAATNFATAAKLKSGNPGEGGGGVGGGGRGDVPVGVDNGGGPPTGSTAPQSGQQPTTVPTSVPADETGTTAGGGGGGGTGGQQIIVQGDIVGDVTPAWTAKLSKGLKRQDQSKAVKA